MSYDKNKCCLRVMSALWRHYYEQVPIAKTIEGATRNMGEAWIEDHVAFRTLPGSHTGMTTLQKIFEVLGYERRDDYHFEEKKLKAFWMAPQDCHKDTRDVAPKIFISELIPHSFSAGFRECLEEVTKQVSRSPVDSLHQIINDGSLDAAAKEDRIAAICTAYLTEGPSWARPTQRIYETLKVESDYAAWTYLFGQQINHFTVSAHLIQKFSSLADYGEYLRGELGIAMNEAGGLVKGTPELKLEQIATMATKVPVHFQEGLFEVSYGFVEFAKRYPLAGKKDDGHWDSYYQGFVAANADKIFESTYR